jgi:quinol monooxygenase YgiN
MKLVDISSEIVSTARVTVPPENRKELCLTISSLLGRIRDEVGCRSYRFYNEAGDQNSFLLIGEWETRDAWDHHLSSDNFAVLLGSLRLLSSRSEISFKLLSHLAGIEAVTRARCEPIKEAPSPILIR